MITIFLYACINPYNSVLHENPSKHIGVVLKPSTTVIAFVFREHDMQCQKVMAMNLPYQKSAARFQSTELSFTTNQYY